MKALNLILTVWLMVALSSSLVAADEWLNLTNGSHITSMAETTDFLWIGTKGGLVKMNKSTLEKTYYNMGNSGLPSNNVEAIDIDANDNIWIGTYDQGIAKFDGTSWQTWNTKNSFLTNDLIYDLKLDANGDVWIGTRLSIIKFDGSNFTDYFLQSYADASSLVVKSPTDIYISWYTNGVGFPENLFHFDGNTVTLIDSFNRDGIYRLYNDASDDLWVCYSGGVAKKETNGWTYFENNAGLPDSFQAMALTEHNGVKYLGTDKGVYMQNGNTWAKTADDVANANYLKYTDGGLWIGTKENGLLKSSNSNLTAYHTSNSNVPFNTFSDIEVSADGSMWFSGNKSIYHFNNNQWEVLEYNGEYTFGALRIATDNVGTLWASSNYTLYKFDGTNVQTWTYADSGYTSMGISFFEVNNGIVYIGTYNDGLLTFNGANFTIYTPQNSSLTSKSIQAIAFKGSNVILGVYKSFDSNTQTYFGGGIEFFDGSNFTRMGTNNSGIVSDFIQAIAIYGDSLWVGGDNGFGLYYNGSWTNYSYQNSTCPLVSVQKLIVDKNGHVWLSGYDTTSSGVMLKWDGLNYTVFDETNSPIRNYASPLSKMLFDTNGNLWLPHSTGTFIYKQGGVTNINETLPPVGIDNRAIAEVTFNAYPNPVENNLTIDFDVAINEGVVIELFDVNGKMVFARTDQVYSRLTIYLSGLESGFYIYQITGLTDHLSIAKGKLLKLK